MKEFLHKGTHWFIFGNWLYGFSAVLLSLETAVQLDLPIENVSFYSLLFFGTIVYYGLSFGFSASANPANLRTRWIFVHKKNILLQEVIFSIIAILSGVWLYISLPSVKLTVAIKYLGLIGIFPLLSLLYYGITFPGVFKFNLRNIGWLKPFTISFVWVGSIAIVPIILFFWRYPSFSINPISAIGFLVHNVMFITVLCILFDIKDYEADYNNQLKTFVVRVGFMNTVYRIVLPLVVAGIVALIFFLRLENYGAMGIILNILPMILLLIVTFSISQERSILFYLFVIDGLMPVKAICGILAAYYA